MSGHKGLRILCLDGGDARCMSQLYTIAEYMRRLEYKLGNEVLPCEHFDLIAAVDSSSSIAIFLGLFGMSVEDAQEAFHDIYTAVFKNETNSPEKRVLILENEVKRLLDAHGIPHTKRMSEFSLPGSSKVAICYSPTARLDSHKFFRNYQSPQQTTQDVTIIEALRAAWAFPGRLPPISIGPKGREQMVMSARTRFANPIREAIKEAYHIFGAESRVSYLLSLGSGFRGFVTVEDGGRIIGAGMDCEKVARDVKRSLTKLKVYYRLSVDHGLEGWESFQGGFGAMKSHVDEYLGRDEPSDDIDQCIEASFRDGRVSLEQIYGFKPQGPRSIHGLPPLSAYFVMRKKPMEAIIKGLINVDAVCQRVMIISGLGGSGKTQLALKFARSFQEIYQHILFIDASSADSLQKGLISRVRSMNVGHPTSTVEEALEILSNPDEEYDKDWFIIFDNADDPTTPLSNYIPPCDHGSILITTRNPALGNLAPDAHLELKNMEEDEAVEVLLSSAFPPGNSFVNPSLSVRETEVLLPTDRDREAAIAIAKELDCLPIAVVQAGCYIQQHKALHHYLDRLTGNRSDLHRRATSVHRDQLKYPHGVYASFDIVLDALSPRALRLLGVLSFFHFSNFPRPLFAIVAESKFRHEYLELVDRPPEFYRGIQFLNEILCPNKEWREVEFDRLLEDLQKYSLVTLVPIHNMITLRFHPLVHNWAQDRLSAEEKGIFQAAAVRLFVCGITEDDDHGIREYLQPHVASISATSLDLHINDQAAISIFVRHYGKHDAYLAVWTRIHAAVEAKYGPQDLRTSRALLQLAEAQGSRRLEDEEKAEAMNWSVVATRETILGRDHPETVAARANLARLLCSRLKFEEAGAIAKEVLRVYIRTWGLCHRDTAQGMMDLAKTYRRDRYIKDIEDLFSGAVMILTKVAGRTAHSTINAINWLAKYHYDQHQYTKAEILRKQVLDLNEKKHGEQHLNTVESIGGLAQQYRSRGRYEEAEALMRDEVETRKWIQGNQHLDTLTAIASLAELYERLERYEDAVLMRKEELVGRRSARGATDYNTMNTLSILSGLYESLERYEDQEQLWIEELARHRANEGDPNYWTPLAIVPLAAIYERRGRYEEAEQLKKETLRIYRATQGHTSDGTLNAIYGLAKFYNNQERYEEAECLWKEQIAGLRAQGSTYVSAAIRSLDKLYEKQGRHEEAVELWREELAHLRANKRDTIHAQLCVIESLAQIYEKQERYDEAEQLWKEELAGCRITKGDAHYCTLDIIHSLAQLYEKREQYKEVEQLLQEELAGRRATEGYADDRTLKAIESLAQVYERQERYEEAEKLWKEGVVGYRGTKGDANPNTLGAIDSLSRFYGKRGRYEEAEKLWKEALAGCQGNEQIPDHYTHNIIDSLAKLYEKQGRYEEVRHLWKERLAHLQATDGTGYLTIYKIRSLAQMYDKLEQYEEAERMWRQIPPELRREWRVQPSAEANIIVEHKDDDPSSVDADSVQDPGGDPTYNAPASDMPIKPLSLRPQSPFTIRAAFRNKPNSWSMF